MFPTFRHTERPTAYLKPKAPITDVPYVGYDPVPPYCEHPQEENLPPPEGNPYWTSRMWTRQPGGVLGGIHAEPIGCGCDYRDQGVWGGKSMLH